MTAKPLSFDPYLRRNDVLIAFKHNNHEWIPDFVNGRIYSTETDSYLEPAINSDGHLMIPIEYGGGLSSCIMLHRALWVMRHGIPLDRRLEVDHINTRPADNRLCNLRLVTPSENQLNNPVKFARAETIRREREAGVPVRTLAERYGYKERMIYNILANECYDPEKFPGDRIPLHLHLQYSAAGTSMVGWNN